MGKNGFNLGLSVPAKWYSGCRRLSAPFAPTNARMAERKPDHARFVELLTTHKQQLMAYARILTFNRDADAEEVFQSATMVAWEKFDSFDQSGDFGAWICRVCYFEAKKLLHARARVRFLSDGALAELADAAVNGS